MNTEAFAQALPYAVKPNTIRKSLCVKGHYMGIRPRKLPNRFLVWPADAVERILASAEEQQSNQGG